MRIFSYAVVLNQLTWLSWQSHGIECKHVIRYELKVTSAFLKYLLKSVSVKTELVKILHHHYWVAVLELAAVTFCCQVLSTSP